MIRMKKTAKGNSYQLAETALGVNFLTPEMCAMAESYIA